MMVEFQRRSIQALFRTARIAQADLCMDPQEESGVFLPQKSLILSMPCRLRPVTNNFSK